MLEKRRVSRGVRLCIGADLGSGNSDKNFRVGARGLEERPVVVVGTKGQSAGLDFADSVFREAVPRDKREEFTLAKGAGIGIQWNHEEELEYKRETEK
jgi:hypothetical protein